MDELLDALPGLGYLPWIVFLVGALIAFRFGYRLFLRVFGMVIIGENEIGVVNKKFVLLGKNRTLPDGSLIALQGEAGNQADTLAPGIHFWKWPWQYEVARVRFITVPQGQLGVVEARDGGSLENGRVLGRKVDCDSFQSAREFLTRGGQRGPQIAIIPPGTYRINTSLFSITPHPVTEIKDTEIGLVTTKDGVPLPTGEIAGGEIEGHQSFQDGETFIAGGGFKGLQVQVLRAGRYYLNPLFATVETVPLTEVPIAKVGVVISYVGPETPDVSGDSFSHGNLVERGSKGVWEKPLDPGKYPINPHTHRVELVPTANVILNWADDRSESHQLDEALSSITVRSLDGFTFTLDVSQVIHIPSNYAPLVIARFGTVANLVTSVLEPTIGNYFRNAAQGSDAIAFLTNRSQRQEEAKDRIKVALDVYNVMAVDTLIGDINTPPELMRTLTDRKLAEQEQVTYATQQAAQVIRQKLEQATAQANTQARVVDAERQVQIKEFEAAARVKEAEGQASAKTLIAEADATVTRVTGVADAGKIKAIGTAEADVIKLKISSMEASNFAAIEVARALSQALVPIVPQIVAGGGGDGHSGSIVDVMMANLLLKDRNLLAASQPAEATEGAAEPSAPAPTAPAVPAQATEQPAEGGAPQEPDDQSGKGRGRRR